MKMPFINWTATSTWRKPVSPFKCTKTFSFNESRLKNGLPLSLQLKFCVIFYKDADVHLVNVNGIIESGANLQFIWASAIDLKGRRLALHLNFHTRYSLSADFKSIWNSALYLISVPTCTSIAKVNLILFILLFPKCLQFGIQRSN